MSEPSYPSHDELLSLSSAIHRARTPQLMVERLAELARPIVPFNGVVMSVLLPEGRGLRVFAKATDYPVELLPPIRDVKGTSIEHALETQQPYVSGDLGKDEFRFPDEAFHRQVGAVSTVLVPLGRPGDYLGTVRYWRTDYPGFSEPEVHTLARFSGMLEDVLQHMLDIEHSERVALRERVLLEVTNAANLAREPREVFESVYNALSRVIRLDRTVVLELQGEELRPVFLRSAGAGLAVPPLAIPRHGSYVESVVVERRPRHLVLRDPSPYPELERLHDAGFQSILVVPVQLADRLFGVLSAATTDPTAYSQEEVELVARAAQQLGLALENARAHAENTRLMARERDLQELSNALTGQLDPREVFDSMVMALKRLTRFDWAVAFEYDDGWLVPLATNAPADVRARLFTRHSIRDSIMEDCVRTARPVVRRHGEGDEGRLEWVFSQGYGSALLLPVALRGQTLGAVGLISRQPDAFPEEDLELVERAVRQFGVAIQAARSFSEVQRLGQRERDLLDITNMLTEYRRPEELFPAMIEALQRLVDFDRAWLYELDGDWLRPVVSSTSDPDLDDTMLPQRWRETSAKPAVESQRPIRYDLGDLASPSARKAHGLGYRSVAMVPVVGRDRVLGLLSILSRNPAALNVAELDLLGRAAQQFGLAMENARGHAQNLQLAEREGTLLELANAMTLHRDPQDLLNEALPALAKLSTFDRHDFAAVMEVAGDLLLPVAANLADVRGHESWRPMRWAELPLAAVVESGESRRQALADGWCPLAALLVAMGFRTLLLVPLVLQARTVGMIWLASRRPEAFAGGEHETLTRVAQQFGLALEAARGYTEIQTRERRLEQENRFLKEELSGVAGFEEIVGVGPALAKVRDLVQKVAPTDTPVLLRGESGTGKELVAEALHRLSRRASQPLIRVNCAALPESLISSELFGHEKGAFTGALAQRLGRFEVARGGTLFLDEIGELSLEVQSKLLRVLQEGEFERVGSSTTLKTDARVVAATNRNLEVAVRDGRFREDLFYRLNVFPITIPPLRERPEDIPVLAHYFLHRNARRLGKSFLRLAPRSEAALIAYPWPGNVRELQNVIERAAILGGGEELNVDVALPGFAAGSVPYAEGPAPVGGPSPGGGSASPAPAPAPPGGADTLHDAERRHILAALRRAGGRIAGPGGAAELLGLKRTTLNSKIKKLGIGRADYVQ